MRILSPKESYLVDGTSFHGHTILATPKELEALLGPAEGANDGQDKVNMEWVCMSDSGNVFTIYDWKTYSPLTANQIVEWHIGAHDSQTANQACKELRSALWQKS